MNMRAKVSIYFLICINERCLCTDMLIEQLNPAAGSGFGINYFNGNPHVASKTIKDNVMDITEYRIAFVKSKSSIVARIVDNNETMFGGVDPSVLDALFTQIDTLFKKTKEAEKSNPKMLYIIEKGTLLLKNIENSQSPIVHTLYNDISTLLQEKFPDFIPIPQQIPIFIHAEPNIKLPQPLPIKLATSVSMRNMKIDQDKNIVSIEYFNPSKEPIAISNKIVKNVPITGYKVVIDKNKKTIEVGETGLYPSMQYKDDGILENLIDHIAFKKEGYLPEKNVLSIYNVDNLQDTAWPALVYNYIARALRENNFFSHVTILTIPEERQKLLERQIGIEESVAAKQQVVSVLPPRNSPWFLSRLLGSLYRRASLMKENYITPTAKKLWTSPTREKILGTLTGVGIGAGTIVAAYYYLYPKPGK